MATGRGHCMVQCEACPIVCSPMKTEGKQCLVLDLRYLNQFLPDGKFKYDLFQHCFNRVSISLYFISDQAIIM